MKTFSFLTRLFALIYVCVCLCATLSAQNAENFIDSVMNTPYGEEMMAQNSEGPFDPSIDTATAAYQLTWHQLYSIYMDSISSHHLHHGIDDWDYNLGKCYNNHFEHTNVAYDRLYGFRLFDGIRVRTVDPYTDDVFGSYLVLPDNAHPDPPPNNKTEYNFDPNSTPLDDYDDVTTKKQDLNFNSVELYTGQSDELIGSLIDTETPQGNRALRLNNGYNRYHMNTASKAFIIDSCSEFLTFSYALVMEDPSHGITQNPFFAALLYDTDGHIMDRKVYIADTSDACYEVTENNPTYRNDPIVYRDWTCDFFDLRPFIGDTVYLDFTAVDCGRAGHAGYAYLGDICDTCCTPDLSVDIDFIQDSMSCKTDVCFSPYASCQDTSLQDCVGELPIDFEDLTLHIITEEEELSFPVPYDSLLKCSRGNELLSDYSGKEIQVYFTSFYDYNCTRDTLYSDTSSFIVPVMMSDSVSAYVSNVLCLYGKNYQPPTLRMGSAHISFPDNYAWCEENSYIEWEGGEFQINQPWEFNAYSSHISFGGVFYVEDKAILNNAELSGTVYLCDENGSFCPFGFKMHLPNANMCNAPGIMCPNWKFSLHPNPYIGWGFGSPQHSGGNYEYYKELTLPFIEKKGEEVNCIITDYTVNIYGISGMNKYLYHNESWQNPTADTPHTIFPNVVMTISELQYNVVEEYELEIFNNCGDTCTYSLPKGKAAKFRSQEISTESDAILKVFPNPGSDAIHIRSSQSGEIQFSKLTGEIISDFEIAENEEITMYPSSYPSGAYLITLEVNGKVVAVKKLLL